MSGSYLPVVLISYLLVYTVDGSICHIWDFFGTFLQSCRIILIPTWKVCRWRFFTFVLCNMSIKLLYRKYELVTQNTHSSLLDYQRRNKYYILPPNFETSKNYINHGQAERWARWQAIGWIATPPPGASSRWVGRDSWQRILLDSLNWLRKKIFIDCIYFILFFASSKLDRVQNNHVASPLWSPPVAHPFVTLPRCARGILVGCCDY